MSESTFGRYELLDLIGQGGMGRVYRAFDTATDRVVALKVLRPDETDDETFQERFRREAHMAAALTDPHVVPIHGYGEIDGQLYLDMRLIEGRDLGQIVKQQGGSLTPATAVNYVGQVAEALHAAHSVGLVHRDVKPSNILITPRDFVYLIDFGIARTADETRVTSTGQAVGTFAYMAPERLTIDGQAGPYADIYSLTCVLYECLTGQTPFRGDVQQQVAGHLAAPPRLPSTTDAKAPAAFDVVIEKGLAKKPSGRYQTALELADAARAALDSPNKRTTDQVKKSQPAASPKKPRAGTPTLSSDKTLTAPTKLAAAALASNHLAGRKREIDTSATLDEKRPSDLAALIILWTTIVVGAVILSIIFADILSK